MVQEKAKMNFRFNTQKEISKLRELAQDKVYITTKGNSNFF